MTDNRQEAMVEARDRQDWGYWAFVLAGAPILAVAAAIFYVNLGFGEAGLTSIEVVRRWVAAAVLAAVVVTAAWTTAVVLISWPSRAAHDPCFN